MEGYVMVSFNGFNISSASASSYTKSIPSIHDTLQKVCKSDKQLVITETTCSTNPTTPLPAYAYSSASTIKCITIGHTFIVSKSDVVRLDTSVTT